MSFNPRLQQYEGWPWASKPNVSIGDLGQHVGYLEGTLRYDSAQTGVYVDPVPGPWYFTPQDSTAVRNFQGFWGLPVTGVVDQATWGVTDYNYFLHHS